MCSIWPEFLPLPNKPWFLHICRTSFLKTLWVKKKLLVMSNFFFIDCVFDPFEQPSSIFIKFEIVVCKLLIVSLEESKICCLGEGKNIIHSFIHSINLSMFSAFSFAVIKCRGCSVKLEKATHSSQKIEKSQCNTFFLFFKGLQTEGNLEKCNLNLTHSHTITPFDASGKQAFWKHCGKRRNCS